MQSEYDTGTGSDLGALVSGLRYEYDGLNLLRVDEIYGSSLSDSGPWPTVEVSTHRPGQLAALLHKRVYLHINIDTGLGTAFRLPHLRFPITTSRHQESISPHPLRTAKTSDMIRSE